MARPIWTVAADLAEGLRETSRDGEALGGPSTRRSCVSDQPVDRDLHQLARARGSFLAFVSTIWAR